MEKGINTIIQETKQEITDLVNAKLKLGLPISVVGLIIDNVAYEVMNGIKTALAEEDKKYNQPVGQVEWKDEEQSSIEE